MLWRHILHRIAYVYRTRPVFARISVKACDGVKIYSLNDLLR
jgi:hypothetical protein